MPRTTSFKSAHAASASAFATAMASAAPEAAIPSAPPPRSSPTRESTRVHYPMRAIQDEVRFPFTAALLGTSIVVTGVDFDGDERRGIVACVARPTTQLPVYNPN